MADAKVESFRDGQDQPAVGAVVDQGPSVAADHVADAGVEERSVEDALRAYQERVDQEAAQALEEYGVAVAEQLQADWEIRSAGAIAGYAVQSSGPRSIDEDYPDEDYVGFDPLFERLGHF